MPLLLCARRFDAAAFVRATLRCRCFCVRRHASRCHLVLLFYVLALNTPRHATRPTKDAQPRQTAAHLTPRALVLFDGSVLWWVCSHSQIRVKRLKKKKKKNHTCGHSRFLMSLPQFSFTKLLRSQQAHLLSPSPSPDSPVRIKNVCFLCQCAFKRPE